MLITICCALPLKELFTAKQEESLSSWISSSSSLSNYLTVTKSTPLDQIASYVFTKNLSNMLFRCLSGENSRNGDAKSFSPQLHPRACSCRFSACNNIPSTKTFFPRFNFHALKRQVIFLLNWNDFSFEQSQKQSCLSLLRELMS